MNDNAQDVSEDVRTNAGTTSTVPRRRGTSWAALVAGIVAVPGGLLTWDSVPGEGFLWGAPFAIVAHVLGFRALQGSSRSDRLRAKVAIGLGIAILAMLLAWSAAASVARF